MKILDIQKLHAFGMLFILLGHMPIVLPNIFLHGYSFNSKIMHNHINIFGIFEDFKF